MSKPLPPVPSRHRNIDSPMTSSTSTPEPVHAIPAPQFPPPPPPPHASSSHPLAGPSHSWDNSAPHLPPLTSSDLARHQLAFLPPDGGRRFPRSVTPSTTSQSDDEEDEASGHYFADKSFLDGGKGANGSTTTVNGKGKAASLVPDEALRWLENTAVALGYEEGMLGGSYGEVPLVRRNTVTKARSERRGSLEGTMGGEEVVDCIVDLLPQEVVVHIFRNLTSAEDLRSCLLVSRAWCTCAVSFLWSKPSIQSRDSLKKLISTLQLPQPTITSPRTPSSTNGHLPPIQSTFPYASFIKRLNFVPLHGTLTDSLLLSFQVCSRLERLTLTGNRGLKSAALAAVVARMPELVAIDLSGIAATKDEVLETIARTSQKLQGINLSGCTQVTDKGVSALARGGRLLRRIKLVNCSLITDVSIIDLATNCPLILEFDLQGVDKMTDASMLQIWLHTSHLRELRLAGNNLLTDAGFPNLRELARKQKAEAQGAAGGAHLSSPPILSPVPLPSIPGSPFQIGSSSAPSNLPSIRKAPVTVNFDYLRTVDLTACANLTDEALDAIISNATKIRTLTLAKCVALTDAALESICRLGRQLHYLHLGHVSRITDAAVCKLARSCNRMRYIDLACCPLLTDMSVFEIATNWPKLRRIGLVKVVNITDQAIYALVERGERGSNCLERVHLSYCDNLSVKAITHLLRRVPHITHLSLTGVSAFRQPEYQRFCRAAPKDFNSHQRLAFCVFSGKGVYDLRDHLLSKEDLARPARSSMDSGRSERGSDASAPGTPGSNSGGGRRRSSGGRFISSTAPADSMDWQAGNSMSSAMLSVNHANSADLFGITPSSFNPAGRRVGGSHGYRSSTLALRENEVGSGEYLDELLTGVQQERMGEGSGSGGSGEYHPGQYGRSGYGIPMEQQGEGSRSGSGDVDPNPGQCGRSGYGIQEEPEEEASGSGGGDYNPGQYGRSG